MAKVRRMARDACSEVNMEELSTHAVKISVTELAQNLLKHTPSGGDITIATIQGNGRLGVEIKVKDKGPGIANTKIAMKGGYSTIRGLGEGLPSVERFMDEFTIKSTIGLGTEIIVRKWNT